MSKESKIISIGFYLPTNNSSIKFQIENRASISEDADIVIFDPQIGKIPYLSGGYREEWEADDPKELLKLMIHWNKELTHLLDNGGTLFIILREQEYFELYFNEMDETLEFDRILPDAELQKGSRIQASNYSCLPLDEGKVIFHEIDGSKSSVYSKNPIFKQFIHDFNDSISYETYIEIEDKQFFVPYFQTRKGKRILGGEIETPYNGTIILLPVINLQRENELIEVEMFDGWRQTSYMGHQYSQEAENLCNQFFIAISKVHKAIKKAKDSSKTPPPNWVKINSDYSLQEEEVLNKQIEAKREQINNIEIEINEIENRRKQVVSLKDLLFETGTPLENAVNNALEILGYEVSNFKNKDNTVEIDHVIKSPEGIYFIGESEGRNKRGVAIDKARQVLANALFALDLIDAIKEIPKSLLFGNSPRLIEPSKRDHDFTDGCKKAASSFNIGLIRTPDLFAICKYIKESGNLAFAKKCREVIQKDTGEVIQFPEIPQES